MKDGPWQGTVVWGDGTQLSASLPTQAAVNLTHVYAAPGTYDGYFQIRDKDGGQGVRTFRIVVQ